MAAKKKASAAEAKPETTPSVTPPPAYVVFARRFRPQSFSEVAGQSAVTNALRQALTSGRLAQAYLLCGPRGVGKTSLARIFAKALNCLQGKGPGGAAEEPCNECDACRAIQEGRALDVIEMDAATNRGIEEVRALRDNVGLAPAELRYKVYIIDEVHMLTREAWNAFLKTLEEPPAHVKFIFATTDPNNVPETILSRCQRFDLRRIGPADIVKRLRQICEHEKVEYEEMALSRIANAVRGGLRDAEGLLDQAVNLGNGKVTDAAVRDLAGAAPDELILDILKGCAEGKTGDVLSRAHSALEAGADPEDMLDSLVERLRGTLLSKVCGAESALLEGQTHLKDAYAALGALFSEDQILMLIQLFTSARRQLRDAAQTRLPLEMALIRAARARELIDLGKLVSALEAGGPNRPPPRAEGVRPNSFGRPAGLVNTPSAAASEPVRAPANRLAGSPAPARAQAAPHASAAAHAPARTGSASTGDFRESLVAAVKLQKGVLIVAGAIQYASAVQLQAASKTLTLGFGPEQAFYAQTLEKTDPAAALKAALQGILGYECAVKVERLAAADAASARARSAGEKVPEKLLPPQRAATRAPVQEAGPDEFPEDCGTEIEFDDSDALPLPKPARPSSETDTAPAPAGDDESVAGHRARVPPAAPLTRTGPAAPAPSATDTKEVSQHPLLQLVLKQTGGVILNVARQSARKKTDAPGNLKEEGS